MPSADTFQRPRCPAAWRAHAFYDPTWRRSRDGLRLDAASVRALLDGAQLPYAELRYMGVPAWLLGNALPHAEWVDGELATQLLGRIRWDATAGADGDTWCGPDKAPGSIPAAFKRDAAACWLLGVYTVRRYFP